MPLASCLLPLALFLPLSHSEENIVPPNTTIDRYQAIWTRSPFTASTAAADEQVTATWVMTGFAGDAQDPLVFLENKDSQERMSVTSNKNVKGFQVLSIDAQGDLLQSTAIIRTPTQGDLKVKFDKDLIAANNPPAMPSNPTPNLPSGFNPSTMPHPFTPPLPNFVHPIHKITIPSPPPPPPR